MSAPIRSNVVPMVAAAAPNMIDDTPVVFPTSTPADQLAAAIRAIAEGSKGQLDEDRVREIAAASAGKMGADLSDMFERRMAEIAAAATKTTRLEVKSAKGTHVVEGIQHEITPTVIAVVALGHNAMMIGPAGCGKTTIGETTARALGLPFYITSIVFDTHELMGFVDGHGKYHSTAFRKAFETGGVWVADEIDAWDAAALLVANSALANGFATFPDRETPVSRHPDFRMIATANTYGHGADRLYVGRNELDAASLDRFAAIDVDYDQALETELSTNEEWCGYVWQVRAAVRKAGIRHVVSTRAILNGQAALGAGMARKTVEELYLFKGMNKNDREMVARNVTK